MEATAIIKSFISLALVLAAILLIWFAIKKFSYKFQGGLFEKISYKLNTAIVDAKNKIVIIEIDSKKYTILCGQNNNLLLDKSDV